MRPKVEAALSPDGLVTAGRGSLGNLVRLAAQDGDVVKLLPGVYARENTWQTRCRAAMLAALSSVIAGAAAPALTWWPTLAVEGPVDVYREAAPQRGFRWLRGALPDDLVETRRGVRVTNAALTVLDLVGTLGARPIDEALRRRVVTIADLNQALDLTPGRAGNTLRRQLLDDSRDAPWSEFERGLHQRLRALRLPWRFTTNHLVALEDGATAHLDVAFPELLLAFEADGYAYHGSHAAFVNDRRRDAQLTQLGWVVVRLAEESLRAEWFGRRVLGILKNRARQLGVPLVMTDSRQIRAWAASERGFPSQPNPA